MTGLRSCVKCGIGAPEANGEITLMSKRGWRVQRTVQPDDVVVVTWHCPACWAQHKALVRESIFPKKT